MFWSGRQVKYERETSSSFTSYLWIKYFASILLILIEIFIDVAFSRDLQN